MILLTFSNGLREIETNQKNVTKLPGAWIQFQNIFLFHFVEAFSSKSHKTIECL